MSRLAFLRLTVSQRKTLRAISLASARGGWVSHCAARKLRGAHPGSMRVLRSLKYIEWGRWGVHLTTMGRIVENDWLAYRLCDEHGRYKRNQHFLCSRCGEDTSASDGADWDAADPEGDMCSRCWVEENENIEGERG